MGVESGLGREARISYQQADDPLDYEQPADSDKAPDGELAAVRPGPRLDAIDAPGVQSGATAA
jgi:hypothetical protein